MVGGFDFSGKYCVGEGFVERAETEGFEAVVVDGLDFKLSREGAKLCLYTTELQLPPCPRMRTIVSDAVAWSSRRNLPHIPRCLPGPRQGEEALSDAACRQG